jgi:hypothetical protein
MHEIGEVNDKQQKNEDVSDVIEPVNPKLSATSRALTSSRSLDEV